MFALICDIQLPFGRHHIHRDLFAPAGRKIDCYWHVFLYSFSTVSLPRAFDLSLKNMFSFGARATFTIIARPSNRGKHRQNASVYSPDVSFASPRSSFSLTISTSMSAAAIIPLAIINTLLKDSEKAFTTSLEY